MALLGTRIPMRGKPFLKADLQCERGLLTTVGAHSKPVTFKAVNNDSL